MKILIIGGAGYIGGALTDILSQADVLDSLLYEDRYFKTNKFFNVDVRNIEQLSTLVHNYDTLVVLAGLVGDAACSLDLNMTKDINVKHVKWLAENYKGKIIYASTCSIYGKNNNLIDETASPNPLSLYAETKLEAEQYLLSMKPDSLIFRLGTLYGTGDNISRPRLDLVVNVLTARATLGEEMKVFGGEQWRPLLHVKDVANGIVYGINNNLKGLFNLSEKNVTMRDIAESIKSYIPNSKIEYNSIPFQDERNYKVKNDKILTTGWQPKFTLLDGIKEINSIIQEKRIKNFNDSLYHNGNYLRKIYARN